MRLTSQLTSFPHAEFHSRLFSCLTSNVQCMVTIPHKPEEVLIIADDPDEIPPQPHLIHCRSKLINTEKNDSAFVALSNLRKDLAYSNLWVLPSRCGDVVCLMVAEQPLMLIGLLDLEGELHAAAAPPPRASHGPHSPYSFLFCSLSIISHRGSVCLSSLPRSSSSFALRNSPTSS